MKFRRKFPEISGFCFYLFVVTAINVYTMSVLRFALYTAPELSTDLMNIGVLLSQKGTVPAAYLVMGIPAAVASGISVKALLLGLGTIATALGEDPGTVEEVYEPFLIMEGFIKRTPRGREVTDLAYRHLGKSRFATGASDMDDLFN